eukprot:517465-Pyramimonas_sp.AAC.1
MQLPSASRERLMLAPSIMRCPTFLVLAARSDPARSISDSLPTRTWPTDRNVASTGISRQIDPPRSQPTSHNVASPGISRQTASTQEPIHQSQRSLTWYSKTRPHQSSSKKVSLRTRRLPESPVC